MASDVYNINFIFFLRHVQLEISGKSLFQLIAQNLKSTQKYTFVGALTIRPDSLSKIDLFFEFSHANIHKYPISLDPLGSGF